MFIGIAGTIPNLPNLPGQGGGGGVEVLLEYDSSSFCKVTTPNLILPTVAEPAGGTFSYTGTGILGIVPSTGLINIAASDSGSYTITYSVDGSSSSFPIAIGNEIILSITTIPGAAICTGDTATLTANASGGSGGFTYSWSTGATSQSIDVTTSGNYTVTVTDSDGCSVSAEQQITASTAATTIASINNDAAMSFNGVDQYIQAVDSSNLRINGDMTISAWVKFDSSQTGDFQKIINKRDSGGTNYDFYLNNDPIPKIKFYDGSNSSDQSTGTITPGSWTHVAITINSGVTNGSTFFIDGAASGTGTYTITSDDGPLYIGRYYDSPTYGGWWPGEMDEIAIFNTALSSCDIKGIYDATTTVNGQPKSANLLDTNTTIPAPVYWNRMGDS